MFGIVGTFATLGFGSHRTGAPSVGRVYAVCVRGRRYKCFVNERWSGGCAPDPILHPEMARGHRRKFDCTLPAALIGRQSGLGSLETVCRFCARRVCVVRSVRSTDVIPAGRWGFIVLTVRGKPVSCTGTRRCKQLCTQTDAHRSRLRPETLPGIWQTPVRSGRGSAR